MKKKLYITPQTICFELEQVLMQNTSTWGTDDDTHGGLRQDDDDDWDGGM